MGRVNNRRWWFCKHWNPEESMRGDGSDIEMTILVFYFYLTLTTPFLPPVSLHTHTQNWKSEFFPFFHSAKNARVRSNEKKTNERTNIDYIILYETIGWYYYTIVDGWMMWWKRKTLWLEQQIEREKERVRDLPIATIIITIITEKLCVSSNFCFLNENGD